MSNSSQTLVQDTQAEMALWREQTAHSDKERALLGGWGSTSRQKHRNTLAPDDIVIGGGEKEIKGK